jgi:hypothetical protein
MHLPERCSKNYWQKLSLFTIASLENKEAVQQRGTPICDN